MKFINNAFPNMDFDPDIKGYKKMREPSMIKLVRLSIPVGLSICILLFFTAQILTKTSLTLYIPKIGIGMPFSFLFWALIFAFFNVFMLIIHEVLHAIVFPEKLSSDNIVFGAHKNGVVFTFYKEDMKKQRMLLSLAVPFLLLSVVSLIIIIILDINKTLLMIGLLYHAFCSAGDIIGMFLIIKYTPRDCF
jgi:hypothetical protein